MEALSVICATFFSGWLAPKIVRMAKEKSLMDVANERSSHTTPTPRGGGIGIVLTVLLVSAALHGLGTFPQQTFLLVSLGLGLVIAALGYLDDRHNLPARLRLLIQLVCIGTALVFLPKITPDFVPVWAEKVFLLLAWTWFVNLYNFMDGLDGLATVQAIFIGLGVVILSPVLAPLALVYIGACMGFLRTNWPPAKIFMGDVGSTFLGFYGAALLLATLANAPSLPLFCSLITVPMLFVADATYTLFKRLFQGKLPWVAHREHWYQRAHLMGMRHNQVLWRAILLYTTLLGVAVGGYITQSTGLTVLAGLLPLLYAARRIVYLEGK
ncbi:MAG: glycosyl transferase [Proteobacteria bacterium]|nr:glycosyl transferase [Pseudomonadota bacterium]